MVHEQAVAALEALAAALPGDVYVTTLTQGPGRPPRLSVVLRASAGQGAEVYAEGGWYWWAWGERIAAVADPAAAVDPVRSVVLAPASHD